LAAGAAGLIALGSVLIIQGSASAAVPINHFPVIRFWNSYHVVTMKLPARVWCPPSKPFCEWQLYVNEPDIPSQRTVGTAMGTSGILTVNYPKHFCGTIQADAIVGPAPWLLEFGHQKAVDTGGACGGSTTTTTTKPPHTTTTTTTKPPHTTTTTKPPHTTTTTRPHHTTPTTEPSTTTTTNALPFSGSTTSAVAAVAAAPTTTPYDPNHASQLPFTGADVRPLAIVGGILILMGIYILTTLEQRRRAMRRMAYAMRTSEAAGRATRITRWFLGD
jgi:hypothetical protein